MLRLAPREFRVRLSSIRLAVVALICGLIEPSAPAIAVVQQAEL